MPTEQQQRMAEAVAQIKENMAKAARAAGRRPEEVVLCAASKTQTVETVRASAVLPIDLFGENHVQELVRNADAGAYLGKPAHLIGHLQTNKIKKVLGRAALIQSVDSLRLLATLEKEAAKLNLTQAVLLEVNVGGEDSKTGLPEAELPRLLEAAAGMPHIRVEGLMTIAPLDVEPAETHRCFARLRELDAAAGAQHIPNLPMGTLSMGMSGDYAAAIAEGATIVRIGTAIYGARDYSRPPKH